MSEERFEVFGNIIKDNEDIPALLNNYQATVRLNELNDKVKELEKDLEFTTKTANELIEIKHKLEQELNSKNMLCENYNCGLNKKIKQLQQELAELKEKAILPKFRIGQKVWSIFVGDYKEICYLEITHIMKSKSGIFYQDNNKNAYWFNEKNTFLTEQEAQAKLQELRGGE